MRYCTNDDMGTCFSHVETETRLKAARPMEVTVEEHRCEEQEQRVGVVQRGGTCIITGRKVAGT